MTPSQYARGFDDRVREVMPAAARRVPPLARRLEAVGLSPDELDSVEALDRLPIMSKDELLDVQAAQPPFGGFLAPDARVRRIFQSPGPLYEPELDETDPWRWAPALRAAGFGPDDVVLNTFSYHLAPAGAMFDAACHALGATVVPAGVGNRDLQARACADLGVTAYVGLPSYLKALLEQTDPSWRLRRAFVTAEPLPPSLRTWLHERVETVHQGYGTAETGNLGYECGRMDGLHVPADALVQICDLTIGAALPDGMEGQIVATVLRPDYPVVRFGTGDLSAWTTSPCACGEPTPRIRGWLGRVGDAVKVRGMFLHPRQVEAVMAVVDDVERYRFFIDRVDHRDVLRCEVVPTRTADSERVTAAVRERVRSGLRFDVEVAAVSHLTDGDGAIADVRTWE